jgi:cell division protease FtsH
MSDDDFAKTLREAGLVTGSAPPDPVHLMASALVFGALAVSPDIVENGVSKGAVVILLTPEHWERPVTKAWRHTVHSELLETPLRTRNRDRFRDDEEDSYPLSVLTFVYNEIRKTAITIDDDIRKALRNGRGLLIVVDDIVEVPVGLQAAADVVVTIPAPTPQNLREVATVVGTGDAPWPDAAIARAVVPDQMLTALRPGQTAADYLGRLERLVAAARPAPPDIPRWTLDTLPLPAEVLAFGRQLQADIAQYKEGKLEWADVDRGSLLFGPPGCAKTTFASALAASCEVPLIVGSYSIWEGGDDGKSRSNEIIKNMRSAFREARRTAPCFLFIDEIDSFLARGDGGHNESWFRPIMNALLAELDGIGGREGVVVIAATNLPSAIDPALRRAGRLDRELQMSLPDEAMLAAIFKAHLPDLVSHDLSRAANAALGASGADCEQIARGARRSARQAGRPVLVSDLLNEIRGKPEDRSAAVLRRIAIHECGHSLIYALQRPGSLISVSIRRGADGIGGGVISDTLITGSATVGEIDAVLRQLMGGRAAEEIVCGEGTAGAGGPAYSDLARATGIAASAELSWGMGSSLMWLGDPDQKTLSLMLATHKVIADRVELRLTEALDGAKEVLRRHRGALDALVSAIIDREVLSGAEVLAIIASVRVPKSRSVGTRTEPGVSL